MRPSGYIRCLLSCLCCCLSFSAFADDGKAGEGITITADQLTYNKAADSYDASGNVRIEGNGMVLTSDSATLTEGGAKATAVGSVALTRDDAVLKGDRLDVDLQKQTGEMSNGMLTLSKGNFRLTGDRILKTGDQGYRVEGGRFTTCDTDPPSWYFSASTVEVTLDEYATGSDVVFRAADVPLFYSPYFIVPVKRERQSGFLYPTIGSSSRKGFYLQVPYYWAISPSMDATIAPGIMSKRGPVLGGEYRYIRSSDSAGSFLGTLMYDTDMSRFRGEGSFKHVEVFSPRTRFAANLNWLSDRDYYRDFSEQHYNQKRAESTAYVATSGDSYALSADVLLTEDLEHSNDTTLQRLPRLAFTTFRTPLFGSPVSFSFDANATNFFREDGERGERIELSPRLSWQTGIGDAINVTTWAGYRQRLYQADGNAETDGAHGDGIPQAGMTASTSLMRVYDVNGSTIRRIRHMMVPEVGYVWVDAGRQDRLPFFDYEDRVLRQNMVRYSLANYLTAREELPDGTASYRDLLSLVIGQGYSFSGERRDLLTLVDTDNPFTDIMLETRVYPFKELALGLDGRYDPYAGKLSTFVLSGDLTDREGNSAGVGYRFARDVVDYFEGRMKLALFRPFSFEYRSRYSFEDHVSLEQLYSLEYRRQCWSIILTYRHRPGNDDVQLGFTLYGLGSPGSFSIL